MQSSAKIREWMDSAGEFLNEQVWFQELKGKWEELDPQSKIYLRFAAVGGGILLVIITILSVIWSVHSLKKELSEKRALLSMIQNANDEINRLKNSIPGGATAGSDRDEEWGAYFETVASTSGMDRGSISMGGEKAGASGDQSKEVLFEVTVKHVSIRQLIRYVLALESGRRPVKLRNLSIDTKGDPSGYMDATLAVSAFTLLGSPL
jgi:type II secretory pathway component PulM